jgi:hypothetical protein
MNPFQITCCFECKSINILWHTHISNVSNVEQGRLRTNDVECLFVLGCEECSETLAVVSADRVAKEMNK